ncbi:fibronectin type III domain-containing protein [Flammeovirga yaeyamensis]|uniref:Fibronectin type III domain-containing protein n=1 Tax=Flammeovirga yaeyamensis TaxID=367791 RepID=A0AAX1NAM8_9BACT|nr:fibronectin type III domain-containing protein [Flammeovirga yaeyamensis]MBB3700096.1 beta-mannanase [Flammeovirga yaeyamensis]NMF37469.1 T9SS type A sorting domain-containing protein [Flammeovirga yaeyamensis]QWG04527.1 fibronectin type III domain-containing protein [Flammeovirga yaeyamensis]
MKRKLSFIITLMMISSNVLFAQNCPPSHPYEACGRCWEDATQAQSGGCTETPPPEETAPNAPSSLNASEITTNSVILNWVDNSADEQQFVIYRDNTPTATLGANVTTYSDNSLQPNQTYQYYVVAENGSLISDQSNVVSVTTLDDQLPPPTNELGTINFTSNTTQNAWTLQWNTVVNADVYTLNVITKDNGTELSNTSFEVTGNNYEESNPLEDITYQYILTVSNEDASKSSNPITKIRSSCSGTIDEQGKVSGKFTPKNGKILMFLGQDNNSVDEYTSSGLFPSIGGFTNYTNIYDFAGLESVNNYGSGDMCIQCGIDKYPGAAVAIGLYMVEDNDGVGEDHPNGLTDVVNGLYDASIDKFANFANRNSNTPIFLRVGYEFDGQWNHYDPQKYINAYKYLVDRLNAAGVENVAYVWQSAAYGFTYNGNPIEAWYPGDAYVDYVGLSFFFYDEGFNGPNLQTLLDIARTKNKPVMMAEVSAQYYDFDENTFTTYDNPGNKTPMTGEQMWNQYFADQLLPFVEGNADVVRAISYINADWQSQEQWKWPDAGNGYWGDTRVQRNAYIATQWNNEMNNGKYQHADPNLYQILTTGCGGENPPVEPPVTANPPSIPQNILVSSSTTTSLSISWSEVTEATSYTVLYGNQSGVYSDSISVSTNSSTITNLTSNTSYYVAVRAVNNDGVSDLGTEVIGTTQDETVVEPPVGTTKIEGKFTPQNEKTLLAIGQDLAAMSGYRNGNMPEPAAAVAYIAFYMLTIDNYGINYGATGMDNAGNFTGVDTDWGSGPLNASSTALGWDQSALVLAMSITENWNQGGLLGIANGQYEANIDKLALFCNSFPEKKIYLRIGYEFDGRWNSQENAGGTYPCGYHKQSEYIAAWQHIVDGMDARGVNNVAYVWQASTSPVDDVLDGYFGYDGNLAAAREDISGWYPGDDYVDWCGISWFISPSEADNYFGFSDVPNLPNQDDLADEMLAFARSHNKPVMICEAAPQGYDLEISEYDTTPSKVSRASTGYAYEGAKTLFTEGLTSAESQFTPGTWFDNLEGQEAWDRWFTPFLNYIHDNEDVIRGVTYINANWNEQAKWAEPYNEGYWGDTRLQENPIIKNLWLQETNSDFWLLGSPSLNDDLGGSSNARRIDLEEELNEITVYPNPASQVIKIKGLLEVPQLELYTLQGKLIQSLKSNELEVNSLPKGLYILRINQTTVRRVVID